MGCCIAREGGICKGAGAVIIIDAAAVGCCSITRNCGIGDGESAGVVVDATATARNFSPGNSHARDGKIAPRGNIENSEVTAVITIVTTNCKRGSTRASDGEGATGTSAHSAAGTKDLR